jgi:hypothetical protein
MNSVLASTSFFSLAAGLILLVALRSAFRYLAGVAMDYARVQQYYKPYSAENYSRGGVRLVLCWRERRVWYDRCRCLLRGKTTARAFSR